LRWSLCHEFGKFKQEKFLSGQRQWQGAVALSNKDGLIGGVDHRTKTSTNIVGNQERRSGFYHSNLNPKSVNWDHESSMTWYNTVVAKTESHFDGLFIDLLAHTRW